jgi:hypothetical protein
VKPVLLDFVVCDDVRHEVGNKLTLVGAYQADIKFTGTPTWPVAMSKLAFFIRVRPIEGFTPQSYEVRFILNGQQLGSTAGSLTQGVDTSKPITIVVVGSPFVLPHPGTLAVEMDLRSGADVRPIPIDRTINVSVA